MYKIRSNEITIQNLGKKSDKSDSVQDQKTQQEVDSLRTVTQSIAQQLLF